MALRKATLTEQISMRLTGTVAARPVLRCCEILPLPSTGLGGSVLRGRKCSLGARCIHSCNTCEQGRDPVENVGVISLAATEVSGDMNTRPVLAEEERERSATRQTTRAEQAFVWACFVAIAGVGLFVLGSGFSLLLSTDVNRVLCPVLAPIGRLLEARQLVLPEDVGRFVLYGQVVPCLLFGFLIGLLWGKAVAKRIAALRSRTVVLLSTTGFLVLAGYVVLDIASLGMR